MNKPKYESPMSKSAEFYIPPQVKVVSFRIERGFAGSPTIQATDLELIDRRDNHTEGRFGNDQFTYSNNNNFFGD